jgi:hypothetical protein
MASCLEHGSRGVRSTPQVHRLTSPPKQTLSPWTVADILPTVLALEVQANRGPCPDANWPAIVEPAK